MMLQRRPLIGAGLALLAIPGVVLPQSSGQVRRIGVLVALNWERPYGLFKEALRDLGYVEGKNLLIEFRTGQGNPEALSAFAAELVRLKVELIVGFQTPAALALKQATAVIPIVMLAGDPVATGIVSSLARPGGNITGLSGAAPELASKLLEFIRAFKPGARRVGVLANATDTFTPTFIRQIEQGASPLGLEIHPVPVRHPDDYPAAFNAWTKSRVDAVIVQPSVLLPRAIELAMQLRLPTFSSSSAHGRRGGLLTYTASPKEQGRAMADYVDRILRGAKPVDLPVQQPTAFELILNLGTAKALGITIPQALLLRADEVIE